MVEGINIKVHLNVNLKGNLHGEQYVEWNFLLNAFLSNNWNNFRTVKCKIHQLVHRIVLVLTKFSKLINCVITSGRGLRRSYFLSCEQCYTLGGPLFSIFWNHFLQICPYLKKREVIYKSFSWKWNTYRLKQSFEKFIYLPL